MRSFLYKTMIIATTLSSLVACGQETDAVKQASEKNETKADSNIINEDVAEFLVKSADARMMDSREGKLALNKGTKSAVRNYGQLMIKDQALLLKEIKSLAAKKGITLPNDISDKKQAGREDLAEKSGRDFDLKFIKMIKIDHERDVKLFKKAIDFEDKDVKDFAVKYLPLIQAHLDKINEIKDTYK